jgi:hypothetical protein
LNKLTPPIHSHNTVAALVSIRHADWETIALSMNPNFIAVIEESRKAHQKEGGVSSVEMRRRLGIKPKRKQPSA